MTVGVPMLCLLASLAACDRLESASQRSRPPRPATPARQAPSFAQSVTIEFDAPADFSSISGFQVGFFSGARILRLVDLSRNAARLSGGTVQLTVPLAPVTRPDEAVSVDLKVRSISAGAAGQWSQNAGSVTLRLADRPVRTAGGGAGRNRAPRGASRQLTPADIETREALKAALTGVLDGITLREALGSFSRVQDLAAAIVLTRRLELSFADLCEAVRDSPRRSLPDGLEAVRPSLDGALEVRNAAAEAKELLSDRRRR